MFLSPRYRNSIARSTSVSTLIVFCHQRETLQVICRSPSAKLASYSAPLSQAHLSVSSLFVRNSLPVLRTCSLISHCFLGRPSRLRTDLHCEPIVMPFPADISKAQLERGAYPPCDEFLTPCNMLSIAVSLNLYLPYSGSLTKS